MDNKVQRVRTDISEPQMAQAIIAAWTGMFRTAPSKEQVSMILAQNNLETGNRKSMWNDNVGNITHTKGDGFDYSESQDWHYDSNHQKVYYTAKFRAYPDLKTGVTDYLKLLRSKRYSNAFEHIVHPDPAAFSKALKAGGYYGADEKVYTAGVTRLFNDANKGSSYEQAMSGKIQPPAGVGRSSAPSAEPSFLAALENVPPQFINQINSFLDSFAGKQESSIIKSNSYTISINSNNDFTSKLEYARILSSALKEELNIVSDIFTNGKNVEMQCVIDVDSKKGQLVLKELCSAVADAFSYATKKIGSIKIDTEVSLDDKPKYQKLDIKLA